MIHRHGEYYFRLRPPALTIVDGAFLESVGVDFGRPPQVVQRQPVKGPPEILVLLVAGHSSWAGLGSREYAPAMYYVFKVERIEEDDRLLMCTKLVEFAASPRARAKEK